MNWQPIETLPSDKFVLLGIWMTNLKHKKTKPEFFFAKWDDERDRFYDQYGDLSLPFDKREDYDFWLEIPELPKLKGAK